MLLAYHDRSDGGVLVTLLEMAFASHCGLEIELNASSDPVAACFSEELGAVLQIAALRVGEAREVFVRHGLGPLVNDVGAPTVGDTVNVAANGAVVYSASRIELHRRWSEVSFRMQALRDNPQCASEAYSRLLDAKDPGLHARLTYDPADNVAAPYIARGARPAVAVLREQGVNSQTEMAAVFTRAGFDAYDVHMTDLLAGRVRLGRFHGLVACGGFSYGDVLGAGEGWAKSILFNSLVRDEFSAFFARDATFTLGVCNGCQMLAALKELIPGADRWPRFVRNRSEQYEARLSLVRDTAVELGVVCRHARVGVADRGGARRRSRGVLIARRRCRSSRARTRHPAVRRPLRGADGRVSLESQRLAARAGGGLQRRRPRHRRDAASGAGIPQRAEFVVAQGVGRGRRMAAVVSKRAGVFGLVRLEGST